MRIVAISDTHTFGKLIEVPDGDVLVHAGDHTFRGTEGEVKAAFAWLDSLPHKHKIAVAGNHDWFFDPTAPRRFRSWSLHKYYTLEELLAKYPSVTYLRDEEAVVDGVKFYGSPWQPWFCSWAFNLPIRNANGMTMQGYIPPKPWEPKHDYEAARRVWAKVPDDTDVLITHSPPYGVLDAIGAKSDSEDERAGCQELFARVADVQPKLHVFGHIHEGYGQTEIKWSNGKKTAFVNASINTRAYEPTNKPIVVDL